jgi:heme exporter protein A
MLEATDLECVRGERTLFSGLGFTLRGGELLRVAGANGSGKTSLLRIVCGLLAPVRGAVRWNGGDIRSLREEYWQRLVYVGHASAVKDDLTAAENVSVSCAVAGFRVNAGQAHAALRQLGLAGCETLPARVLSQGQRRRVVLARLALSGAAPLWVLDEPFTALDAEAVDCVQALIQQQLARGASVMLTTHQDQLAAAVTYCIDLDSREH